MVDTVVVVDRSSGTKAAELVLHIAVVENCRIADEQKVEVLVG